MSESLRLTLLLGGVRAGKSARALQIANQHSREVNDVLFVATAQAFDDEMRQRIRVHQAEREPGWLTVEEPVAIGEAIRLHIAQSPRTRVIIVDCITLWVSNLILALPENSACEERVGQETSSLIEKLEDVAIAPDGSAREIVIVSNEVGLGIVPPTALGRQYRDALGRANQMLAAAARDVTFMVAGLEMRLKGPATA